MQVSASDQETPAKTRRRSHMTPGRDQVMLEAIASPLEPSRAPEFIRDSSVEAPGWHWIPAGADSWKWLGRSTRVAAERLAELRAKAGR